MSFLTEQKSVPAITIHGEYIQDSIEAKVDIETVQHLVENFPRNSYGTFYNDCFEDENFVFIMNGEWYFFDVKYKENGQDDIIQKWDWNKEPMAIVESYENDLDEIERFNNGWEYISMDYFEDDDIILERFTNDSAMVQMPLPTNTNKSAEAFVRMKLRKIVSNDKLSDFEKVNALYEMMVNKK